MRISERGQITIPKALRDRFGMHHNVEIEITPAEQGLLIQKRTTAQHPVDRVSGILDRALDVDEYFDVDEYVAEIRGT